MRTNRTSEELFHVQRKIITGFILGQIQPNEHRQEYPIFKVKLWLKKIREKMGDDEFAHVRSDGRKLAHIIVNIIFDKICDYEYLSTCYGSTSERGKFFAEKIIDEFFGKNDPQKRWNDGIWKFKKQIDLITKNSIAGISQREFRIAYDDLVHAVVDDICDELKFDDFDNTMVEEKL